ncbi:MAG: porin family protein [Prevotella sp.]|nr:porin family protein [Prevotella sp.]
MKKLFTMMALAVAFMTASTAQAQIKFGLKGGLNVTNMSLSKDVVKADNQTGFFVGPTVKVTLPLVGLGIDAAALYDQRDAKLKADGETSETFSQKSINIPINVRYGIGLGSMASVYLAAGPQFGFNVGKKNYEDADFSFEKSNFSVNVGAGVSLIQHVEIGFTYNIALGKTGEFKALDAAGDIVTGKARNNSWQVSAAYYF